LPPGNVTIIPMQPKMSLRPLKAALLVDYTAFALLTQVIINNSQII